MSEHERSCENERTEFERAAERPAASVADRSPWIDRLRARVRELGEGRRCGAERG